MGYICERHNKRPGDGMRLVQSIKLFSWIDCVFFWSLPSISFLSFYIVIDIYENDFRCEQRSNDRIAAFKTARGCPAPTCLGKGNYNIVDSWKKPSNGAHLASLYGFAVSITLPDTAFDSDGGAVMLRKE